MALEDSVDMIFEETRLDPSVYKTQPILYSPRANGGKGDSLYIINHGELTIYKTEHIDKPIAELKSGDFFGEMALLGEQVRTANVKVNKPTSLLRLTRKDVLLMAESEPELKNRLERAVEERK